MSEAIKPAAKCGVRLYDADDGEFAGYCGLHRNHNRGKNATAHKVDYESKVSEGRIEMNGIAKKVSDLEEELVYVRNIADAHITHRSPVWDRLLRRLEVDLAFLKNKLGPQQPPHTNEHPVA